MADKTWAPGRRTRIHRPAADSVSPNPASGPNQTFALNYSAHNGRGYTDLNMVFVRFNGLNAITNGCEVLYYLPLNRLYLVNDAGTAFEGGPIPGTAGTLGNSQCTVNGARSSVSGSNQTLTLNLSVSATGAFTGSQPVYLGVIDSEGTKSGWQQRGRGTFNSRSVPNHHV